MPSAHALLLLLATYGYPGILGLVFLAALGIGAPIPVTALLLTLGALSGVPGGPSLPALAVAAVAGAASGHTVDYWGGRFAHRLVSRQLARAEARPGIRGLLQRTLRLRGGLAGLVFLSRFLLSPIASPVSLFAGVTGMAFATYLILEALGDAIYVLGNLTLGRIFGAGLVAHGGALPAFWLVAAAASLAPVVLVRIATQLTAPGDAPSSIGPEGVEVD
jgi:membrane protein DedA with SNARE-associated domain